jgi:signal transduction histidine kinase
MDTAELLQSIRAEWLARASKLLAHGEEIEQSLANQLDRFFDLIEQAVVSEHPAWLDPILDEWAEAHPVSELNNQQTRLSPLLNQLFLLAYEVSRDLLTPVQALDLFGRLLPYYIYAFEYTCIREAQKLYAHKASDLEKAHAMLERLDRSKSDFIAVAAHELKTPLTLIEGYTAMLRETLPPEAEDPHPALFLKGVGSGARRLREIVDDMIDVSMIDNQQLSLNIQPMWLNHLMVMIKNELGPTAAVRRQTLDFRKFPGSDEMTFGDGERLYQALKNVIANAIKYTPDGGLVTVDGRRLPGFVEIIVSDNGIGIDPEDHARIFEKFGRVGDSSLHSSGKTKFKGGGPGLGLPIARGIIAAHGGAIWVLSDGYDEVRRPGSQFHILLPLRTEPPDDKTAKLFEPLRGLFRSNPGS